MSTEPGLSTPACTLPAAERPLRQAEFDTLFATAVRGQRRSAATRLRLVLDPAAEHEARDLTARETACCSFFTFTLTSVGDDLLLDIEVPPAHAQVLDSLARRAAAAGGPTP